MSFPISLITLTRDNPSELSKTVKSVSLQSQSPATYLVLDSSKKEFAEQAKSIAESVGATYVWTRPEGIYSAMRQSLEIIPHESFSWWINSSDWLAGRRSVETVHRALDGIADPPSWLVGQLLRVLNGRWGYHNSGVDGPTFVRRMKVGQIGFPHPSTVFWTPHLKQVSPYRDGMTIAEDYSTALRYASVFGPPLMSGIPLAVHVPNGLSVRRPVKNLMEKSRARLDENPGILKWFEPGFVSLNALRGALGYLSPHPGGSRVLEGETNILGGNQHFCVAENDSSWPKCCDRILET